MKTRLALFTSAALIAAQGAASAADVDQSPSDCTISRESVEAAQDAWARGIEKISQTFVAGNDYRAAAVNHIQTLYAYGDSEVLFKPTLASEDQFRETFDEALSYFVGGSIAEDNGFAIKPWTAVRFGKGQISIHGNSALAMGNYYFTPADGTGEVKVEYSFGYIADKDCNLKINLHHSSLPFAP